MELLLFENPQPFELIERIEPFEHVKPPKPLKPPKLFLISRNARKGARLAKWNILPTLNLKLLNLKS